MKTDSRTFGTSTLIAKNIGRITQIIGPVL
jgi:hypothetical protein